MKTPILFISFLFLFACSLQAQHLQRNEPLSPSSERFESNFKPTQPGFKPDRMVVPVKRNMFNASASVWKWDTIFCFKTTVSAPYYRVTRKYSSAGDSLIQLMEISQTSFAFVNYARESFTFDSAGNWLTYLSEKWENNAWVNQSKKTFVYNSNGEMVDWKTAGWNSASWANEWHYVWHFDANGLNDTSLFQMGQDSLWVNNSLYIATFDSNGYRTDGLVYSWINNGWSATRQYSYINDSNGNLLSYIGQDWVNSAWVNSAFTTINYDTAGNRTLLISRQWQNNDWLNTEAWYWTYDGNGNNTVWADQYWVNGSWVDSYRDLFQYDASNNILSHTSQNWDNTYWKNGDAEQYTYDAWGNSLTGKYFHWYGGWQPYDGSLMVYADHLRDDYVNLIELQRYEAVIDSILVFTGPALSKGEVTLYPNPAHSIVYISSHYVSTDPFGSITVYDLRGQLVCKKPVVNETTRLDLSGLKPGVYIVKFNSNQVTRVMKLVKD